MRANAKQIRRLFRALARGDVLGRAAMKPDLCPNTARRYVSTGLLPSAEASARTWRTRADPFANVWTAIEVRLLLSPTLQANTIFDDLVAKHPGRYGPGQLRTLQRRVRIWRASSGPGCEPFFPQEHRASEAAQVDFTWATADDYVTKPFGFPELLARLRVAPRHATRPVGGAPAPTSEAGRFASISTFVASASTGRKST